MEPRDDLVPMMMMEMFKKRRKRRSGHDTVMSCLKSLEIVAELCLWCRSKYIQREAMVQP